MAPGHGGGGQFGPVGHAIVRHHEAVRRATIERGLIHLRNAAIAIDGAACPQKSAVGTNPGRVAPPRKRRRREGRAQAQQYQGLVRSCTRHHCIHGWLLNEKGRINTKPPGPSPPSSGTALASRCGCWRSSRPRRQGNVGASTAHNQRCQSISRFIWKIVNTFNVSCSGGVHCGRVVRFLCPHQCIAGHPSDARSLNARVARMSQRGKRVCMTMKRS